MVATTSTAHSAAASRDATFATLALPLLPAVTRLARSLAGNAADADDLVQETFLRAFRYWSSFDQSSDCRLWLARICRNVLHDMRRREARELASDEEELDALSAVRVHKAAVAAGLGDMYTHIDLGDAIRAAIERLEPAFRDVVVMRDVEGFSYEEIADVLAIPLNTVRSRLYRGRRRLQEALMTFALDAGFGAGPSTDRNR